MKNKKLEKWLKELEGEKFSRELLDILYQIYMTEMPYGTARARDGDPDEWLSNEVTRDLKGAKKNLKYWFENNGEVCGIAKK